MTLFIKYKNRWSHGKDKKWTYVDATGWEDHAEDYVQEHITSHHNWSEHYRGCEYHKVKRPPKWWLEAEVQGFKNHTKYLSQQIAAYSKLLKGAK